MQNTGWVEIDNRQGLRTLCQNGSTYTVPVRDYSDYFFGSRSGKRVKPVKFLPQYGTESFSGRMSFRRLVAGLEWLGPTEWREPQFGAYDLQTARGAVWQSWMKEEPSLGSRIQNKVITSIMGTSGQLANDLLELGKTRRMVGDALHGLLQGFRDIRHGQPLKSALKELERDGWKSYLGNRWLEYIYGWTPTVSGAFDTAETLSRQWYAGYTNLSRCSVSSGRYTADVSDIGYSRWGGAVGCTSRIAARFSWVVSNPQLVQLRALGLTNPAAIAWEATPWSFVFDWGLRFGDYLSRLDWDLGIGDVHVQYSIYHTASGILSPSVTELPGYTIMQPGKIAFSSRSAYRSPPSTKLINSWKGVRGPFSSQNAETRLASALALLNQLLSRR